MFEKIIQLDNTNTYALEGTQQIIVDREIANLKKLESHEKYEEILSLANRMANQYPFAKPNGETWKSFLNSYTLKSQLEQNYQLAKSALKAKNKNDFRKRSGSSCTRSHL